MNEVEEARDAVMQSRAQRYWDESAETTLQLTTAVDALCRLETALREEPPGTPERRNLTAQLLAFRAELHLAERLHQQAEAWQNRWAEAVHEAFGLAAAAYGPGGSPAVSSIRRSAWEG